ncbi:site-specific integrase [Amycolatopsis sp. cmx-11-12]|uniref:site-specific integrase n=1 Tax=Amycolatopsis sp. cmx-11-12 TaxID=2785795 RepID=UPI00391704FB
MDLELPNRCLHHLHYRSMSPNTIVAYARNLALFLRFLSERQGEVLTVGPASQHVDE